MSVDASDLEAIAKSFRRVLGLTEALKKDLLDVLGPEAYRAYREPPSWEDFRRDFLRFATRLFAVLLAFSVILLIGASRGVWYAALAAAVSVVLLSYWWVSSRRYGTRNRCYRDLSWGKLEHGLRQLTTLQAESDRWVAMAALSYLTGDVDQEDSFLEAAESLSEKLTDARSRAYRLATFRNMAAATNWVQYGRGRLVPMKSTRLQWRDLDRRIGVDADDELLSSRGGLDPNAYDTCKEAWRASEEMVEDAKESIDDYKWNGYIAIGGFAWTAIVAAATWAVSRP